MLPNLAEFIEDGEIALRTLHPLGSIAVAADAQHSLAMLVRRKDETLTELLMCLDHAIGLAITDDILTDEVNDRTSR